MRDYYPEILLALVERHDHETVRVPIVAWIAGPTVSIRWPFTDDCKRKGLIHRRGSILEENQGAIVTGLCCTLTLRSEPTAVCVDVHSHYFRYPEHFSEEFKKQSKRARNGAETDLTVRWNEYSASAASCGRTIVFGGKARLSGLWVPDREVAQYVSENPSRLIGFLSVDPTQAGWRDELIDGHQHLKLRGIKLLPMYAGFRPDSPELDELWYYAAKHGLPVLLHTGTTFIDKAPLLFGSDYPFTTVDASIAALRKLNAMLDGTALPRRRCRADGADD